MRFYIYFPQWWYYQLNDYRQYNVFLFDEFLQCTFLPDKLSTEQKNRKNKEKIMVFTVRCAKVEN